MDKNLDETRIFYHIDDQDTPYLVKLNIPSNSVKLLDFKNILNLPKSNYKFFFKSFDEEIGVVKEEVFDDNAKLPLFKGRVVAWLVSSEGSNLSEGSNSQITEISVPKSNLMNRNINLKNKFSNGGRLFKNEDFDTSEPKYGMNLKKGHCFKRNHNRHQCNCTEFSGLTSDMDSSTFIDTDDDESYYQCGNRKFDLDDDDFDDDDLDDCETMTRISSTTEETSISKIAQNRLKRKKRFLQAKMQGKSLNEFSKNYKKNLSRASSLTSITDSTMSLDVITVNLHLTHLNFLGISIVGQSYNNGDGGIYVGSIMSGGAVAEDGRIEPGDMILQVNDVNFENLTNDEAVQVLREAVSKYGLIKLVVAKRCWLETQQCYGKPSKKSEGSSLNFKDDEPVRPIDPMAWVEHTKAVNKFTLDSEYPDRPDMMKGDPNLMPDIDLNDIQLTTNMEMLSISRAMSASDSGLEVKNRTWLKITIPNAFLGSEVVNWLFSNVKGFNNKKEAKKYAANMLKNGYIKHTVNKSSFSEQCYYTFSEIVTFIPTIENLKINDDYYGDKESEFKRQASFKENQNLDLPNQFLPLGDTINYGVFGACPTQSSINQQVYQDQNSIISPSSDQLSQNSGPIHISVYQQQMKTQNFYSNTLNQQQLNHPPFAPKPNQNQLFMQQHQLRKTPASSNSSETQSSLNTLSTRDTAIGIGNKSNFANSILTNSNTAKGNGLSNLVNHHLNLDNQMNNEVNCHSNEIVDDDEQLISEYK